jgi:hypothetical protein
MTLYTNNRMGGALTMQREQLVMPLDALTSPSIKRVGNTMDSAIPLLDAEFTKPQLMPKQNVIGALDEKARKATSKVMRDHFDGMKLTITRTRYTHFWVA